MKGWAGCDGRLAAAVWHDDPGALSLLLEALQASGHQLADTATEVLPEAAVGASLPVVGRDDTAARLRAVGAADDSTDIDHFIATVGSRELIGKPGDWTGTVTLLIDAGASKPPSAAEQGSPPGPMPPG